MSILQVSKIYETIEKLEVLYGQYYDRSVIMDVLAIVKKNKTFLKERFGVKKIGVFGSMVRGEAKEESDVDVLVEFENTKKSFDNFMELSFFLEDLFGKKVDLITTSGLDKYVRPYVEREVVWCEK